MRAAAYVAGFALLASLALAAEPSPRVALVVHAHGASAGGELDGAPLPSDPAALRGLVRERLGVPSPLGIEVEVREEDGRLAVAATFHPRVDVAASLVAHAALLRNAVELDRRSVPVPPGEGGVPRSVALELPRPASSAGASIALWVESEDDPSGRFRAGEVLQSAVADAPGSAVSDARVVLVEVRSGCAECGPLEAAAREAAASLAFARAPDAASYFAPPPLARGALAVALSAAFAAWIYPRRGGA